MGDRFKDCGGLEDIKEQVVKGFAPLIKKISLQYQYLNPVVDIDDLISVGNIGLLDAFRKYDMNKKASFKTYALIRIRGSIIDELRKSDFLPRSARDKHKEIAKISRELEEKQGVAPSHQEVQKKMGIDHHRWSEIKNTEQLRFVSFNEYITHTNSCPVNRINKKEVFKKINQHLHLLSHKERLVLFLRLFQGKTQKQVGMELKLTPGRISQLEKNGKEKLKEISSNLDLELAI
ncbi:MAG: sigma-70 family RNA polymerase sigma factor [Bacteriovoracaceae bacterium]|jgi:RNA polymerase sigma factor FliA|nr:sigma-70 family RNA polymerase sigma factor [Bacteriovoracaceae bacterium]